MSGAKGFTEAELANLSDEERAAIEAYDVDDTTDDDLDAGGNDTVAGGEDTTAGADGDDTTTGGEDTTAGGEDTTKGGDDTIQGAGGDVLEDDETPYVPTMKVNGNLDELKTSLDTLTKEKADLNEKFKSGDITQEDYMEQSDKLNDTIADKKSDIRREEEAIEFNKNQEENVWRHQVDQFFKTPDGKIIEANPMLTAAFDSKVRELGADDANKDKTGPWFLKTAAAEVKKLMAGAFETKDPKENKGKDDEKGKGGGNNRKPDLSGIPKTLSNLPAAADDDTTKGDEFGYLDKLEGSELEDELAKMERSDPAKYDRYLKAA
jgi:hypothetical protein